MDKNIGLKIGKVAYPAFMITLKLATTCALSDTIFGNLIRYHHAVDTGVLQALTKVIELNGIEEPLVIDEVAVLNIVAPCDIARKMYASEAYDEVIKTEGLAGEITTDQINRLIDFANYQINFLIKEGTYKKQIEDLLRELEEKIQPV